MNFPAAMVVQSGRMSAASQSSGLPIDGRVTALKVCRLAIVIQCEFEQVTSKFPIKYFTSKVSKSKCLLSKSFTENLKVQFQVVRHRSPPREGNASTARVAKFNPERQGPIRGI
jgi:hypothetical protein